MQVKKGKYTTQDFQKTISVNQACAPLPALDRLLAWVWFKKSSFQVLC